MWIKLSHGNNQLVNILGSIDDKIENNEKMLHKLQNLFYKSCNKYFLKTISFTKGNLTDIATYLNGLAMQNFKCNDKNIGLKVLKIRELSQGFCDDNSDICTNQIKSEYIINNGDVIFSWSGTLLVDIWSGEQCGLNQHLFKVFSDKYPKWLYYFWTLYYLPTFQNIASGKATTMGHIKREDLCKAKIKIPQEFEKTKGFDVLLNKIIFLNKINNKLKTLKKLYLKKFFN